MPEQLSPFTKEQLIPKEETLELSRQKAELFIGIPKETSYQEKRVCLTPDAAAAMVANGHRILLESGAGQGANFSDNEYTEVGVEVTVDANRVFACPIILKVEPPSISEIEMTHPKSIIISALQLKTRTKKYFESLAAKQTTALAFEFIKDEGSAYPVVRALSEIAGTASVLIAAELMASVNNGKGLMMGNISGVPPTEVVIIGAGAVGEYAARAALGLGTNVKIFDNSLTKLRCIQRNLNRPIYTSTIQPKTLLKALKRCDLAIGAVRGKNRAPVIVSQTMVEQMKAGSVIVDVSIDMGGCFETSEVSSHEKPSYIKHGVIHYGVPNILARYARTASASLSNIFTPYLLKVAEEGGIENSLRKDHGLKNGLYFYHGILTNKSVADWFDLEYRDVNLIIF